MPVLCGNGITLYARSDNSRRLLSRSCLSKILINSNVCSITASCRRSSLPSPLNYNTVGSLVAILIVKSTHKLPMGPSQRVSTNCDFWKVQPTCNSEPAEIIMQSWHSGVSTIHFYRNISRNYGDRERFR
jgi:hypothetical protein